MDKLLYKINKDVDKSEKILLASFFFVYLQQFKCLTFKI